MTFCRMRHMGPKVELLEHHRQIGANAQHLFAIARAAVMDLLPFHVTGSP